MKRVFQVLKTGETRLAEVPRPGAGPPNAKTRAHAPRPREDPDAEDEQRFVTLGSDLTAALLVVVYTYREPDVIRLISA